MELAFRKMHGLGNDFVVLDGRREPILLDRETIVALGNRRTGIGFDQLLVIERPRQGADASVRFYNSDGGEIGTCGNGSRCIGRLLLDETGRETVRIETGGGEILATDACGGQVAIDMGPPRCNWRDIPLAREADTLALDLPTPAAFPGLPPAVAVSMGNPHAVFFVEDIASVPIAAIGPDLEHDPIFPARANIEFAQILSRGAIRMRVWERGAGITQACGSGACATLVAAVRRGLTERRAVLHLDGGDLTIEWMSDGNVLMIGPVATSFDGRVDVRAARSSEAA